MLPIVGEGVLVKVGLTIKRPACKEGVIKYSLHCVRIFGIGFQAQHTRVPHDAPDTCACLSIRTARQFVVGSKRFVVPTRTNPARNILLPVCRAGPEAVQSRTQSLVAGFGNRIGDPGHEVRSTDGMPDDTVVLADREKRVDGPIGSPHTAAFVDKVAGGFCIARLLCDSTKLNKGHFHFRMSVHAVAFVWARPERIGDMIGEFSSDV